jgi:hypothetical protein
MSPRGGGVGEGLEKHGPGAGESCRGDQGDVEARLGVLPARSAVILL